MRVVDKPEDADLLFCFLICVGKFLPGKREIES